MANIINRLIGSRNTRLLKELQKIVVQINKFEPVLEQLSDSELAAKTPELRERLANGVSVEEMLPEAFAVVREVSKRTLNMRHFDVQLIGGIVLHRGKIAEMRTGEGKTLAATLPVYLNALAGLSVHIVTVNDYLARRDAKWMGAIYEFLGISVGVVVPNQQFEEKQQAYSCDVVYGTNNEFGFDYLRDNMAISGQQQVQQKLTYAIVDEVDSILIDEARTPLIISGAAEDSTQLYEVIDKIAPKLVRQEEEDGPGDFSVDEKTRQIYLTDEGHETAEKLLVQSGLMQPGDSLYDYSNLGLVHHVNAALRAHNLFQRDVDYLVNNGEVVIVDEFTGRMMAGRRWSDGLHQAVEAKERVKVQHENQTLASITFQNYFRLYDRLAGMTGTADTEAEEFQQIYELEVSVIPTHMDMVREDLPDLVYRTVDEKFKAIVSDIKERSANGQPILVGTPSIESSEYLAGLLRKAGISHEVLNAKHHESEAKIIAQAGRPNAVTIATNMAGRGTDIVLGGNLEIELQDTKDTSQTAVDRISSDWQARHDAVVEAGGLHVLSTERHESRRVDNQLRGRSGRQGDPGSSQFFLSLQDNLLRIFASDKVAGMIEKIGLEEDEAIEHPWVTKAIENAQKKVEGRNFDIRKQLLEYDDVANEQRKVVYEQRDVFMKQEDVQETLAMMRKQCVNDVVASSIPPSSHEEQWDVDQLAKDIDNEFMLKLPIAEWLEKEDLDQSQVVQRIEEAVNADNVKKFEGTDQGAIRAAEKSVMLMVLDMHWKEHLANMDHLRQGIHLRGYAQKNPKQEYKREAFEMFTLMLDNVRHSAMRLLSRLQVRQGENAPRQSASRHRPQRKLNYLRPEMEMFGNGNEPSAGQLASPAGTQQQQSNQLQSGPSHATAETVQPFVREGRKIGRNEPCPCGSGKKYKICHGR